MSLVKLINFVKEKHSTQVRKYTGEPYFNHLLEVASMVDDCFPYAFEIGLLHDILEDWQYTNCTMEDLYHGLIDCGYHEQVTEYICNCVDDLSDVYTHDMFPEINRQSRKKMEAERLWTIHPNSQSVKYCDLINNTSSIVQHDPKFAVVYLQEKEYILTGMTAGDPLLLKRCQDTLLLAKSQLFIDL